LDIRVGSGRFSARGISLGLEGEGSPIRAELSYGELGRPPLRLLSPGVMGPFSFLPFMQCRHGLVSLSHDVDGMLEVEGRKIDMGGGRGYIEKDWGGSMPRSWIWMQSNDFPARGDSVMLSIADIPWLGGSFTGFLFSASLGGRYIREATYTGARVEDCVISDGEVALSIARGGQRIDLRALRSSGGPLRAPVDGLLTRRIVETGDAVLKLRWTRGGELLFEGEAPGAGLELVGDPASLFAREKPSGPTASREP
jgi:tocopherol cyclase